MEKTCHLRAQSGRPISHYLINSYNKPWKGKFGQLPTFKKNRLREVVHLLKVTQRAKFRQLSDLKGVSTLSVLSTTRDSSLSYRPCSWDQNPSHSVKRPWGLTSWGLSQSSPHPSGNPGGKSFWSQILLPTALEWNKWSALSPRRPERDWDLVRPKYSVENCLARGLLIVRGPDTSGNR